MCDYLDTLDHHPINSRWIEKWKLIGFCIYEKMNCYIDKSICNNDKNCFFSQQSVEPIKPEVKHKNLLTIYPSLQKKKI